MAKNPKFDLQRFHFEHRLWGKEIDFVNEEVTIFEHLLDEMKVILPTDLDISFAETLQRISREIEHFKRINNTLKSEIHAQENVMAIALKNETVQYNDDIWATQVYLREKMDFYHDNYRKFKTEFRLFIGKDLENHFSLKEVASLQETD